MSERTPHQFVTADNAPAIEPVASIMEYGRRLSWRHRSMLAQLERLRDWPGRWIISGPTRLENWHVGAIVVGPTGFFLLWPKAVRVEPGLWDTLRECREHVQRCLGEQSAASVEVVVFSPTDEPGHMERWVSTKFDMLTADGNNLDWLLIDWEPVSGVYLGDEWLAEFERASEPREGLYGPDTGAQQKYPLWVPPRADPPAGRRS